MKVFQCIQNVGGKTGGFDSYTVSLAEYIRDRGHQIVFAFASPLHPDIERGLRESGAEVHILKEGFLPFRSLARLVRKTSPDLIVGHFSRVGTLSVFVGRFLGIPALKFMHARVKPLEREIKQITNPVRRFLTLSILRTRTRMTGRVATGFVAVSKSVKDDLIAMHRAAPDKIVVLYNGVEIDKFKPEPEAARWLRQELHLRPEDLIVLTVAVARPEKRVKDFVAACASLKEMGVDNCVFVHVGGGPLESDLKRQAAEFELSDTIRFLGYRTDVAGLLAGCDIFVLASETEACPLALLEAMAIGCTIIATDVGGSSELLEGGDRGILVPAGDVESLAKGLKKLISDTDLRAELGEGARRIAKQEFALADRLAKEVDLYESYAPPASTTPA